MKVRSMLRVVGFAGVLPVIRDPKKAAGGFHVKSSIAFYQGIFVVCCRVVVLRSLASGYVSMREWMYALYVMYVLYVL